MIKKSFRLMLLVAFALSSVMFVACNKYDDDIERIDNQIAALEQTVQSLKAAVDGGAVITGVSNSTEGVKFTLSNGQSYTVNHGTDGAAGKDGSVVTIGENGNWFIDGEDTGKTAKGHGEAGKSPRINEAGNWEVWNAETAAWEDTNVSAAGAQTYVVDCGSYYELNVMQKVNGENAGFTTVKLSKTADITSIKAYTIDANGVMSDAVVNLNYGEKLTRKITFNDKTYSAGTNLIAAGSSLSALVNPVSVDASIYSFSLVDSKGNAPYVISNVTENMTESALTKANETPNTGVWDMNVTFSSELLFSDEYDLYDYAAARSNAVYALTTETANGTVASAYDVKVIEEKIELGDLSTFAPANLEGNVNKAIDLTETFGDNLQYVVDYYFSLADNAAAATVGATLNGDALIATKPGTVKVKVNYLLVDGTCIKGTSAKTIEVKINHVAESAILSDVVWTINKGTTNSKKRVGVSISGIKAMITPTSDNDIIYVKLAGWTWADETELNSKTVVVNKVKYGEAGDAAHKFATDNVDSWIAKLVGPKTNRYATSTSASNFARSNYVTFEFDYANAFPGEYMATLEFRLNSNDGEALVTAPVKVIIKAPETTPFQRLDAYFDGDNAVAYGTANGTNVTYNLFDLYEEMSDAEMANVRFGEDNYDPNYDVDTEEWIVANDGSISLGANAYNYGDYNLDDVYTTREMYASYTVFGNEHIPYVTDTFNLTIKSEIAEGKLDASAAATVITNAIDEVPVSLKNIKATDVYGRVYNLGTVYSKDADGYWTVKKADADSRIKVKFYTEDTQYITVVTDVNGDAEMINAGDGFSAIKVKRAGNTVLTKDQECTVYVEVLDDWGRYTESSFKVTLKK